MEASFGFSIFNVLILKAMPQSPEIFVKLTKKIQSHSTKINVLSLRTSCINGYKYFPLFCLFLLLNNLFQLHWDTGNVV